MPILNVNDILRDVFGLTGVGIYFPRTGVPDTTKVKYGSIPTIDVKDSNQALSLLGTPVIDQVYVKPINYTILDRNNNKKLINFPGYQFPDATLIEVNLPKIIKKTPVNGNEGTVKEYIGIDDYRITIRSVIVNPDEDYTPEKEINNLMQMFKVNTSLQVVNPFLNLLDVDEMVVENLDFPAVEGFPNVQAFVLECVSDRPYELKIREI